MKVRFSILLILAFSLAAAAQSPNKILSQANKTLGGEKALKAIISRAASGKITRQSDGATGTFQTLSSSPNFYAGTFDLNGFETAVSYNGKSGWIRDSRNGLRTLTGDASRDFQAETVYRNSRWLNAKADKTKITSGGASNINGKTANVVLLTTTKGAQIRLFFDAASGLLLREEIPQGAITKTFDYSDYRKVGSVMEAFSIVSKVGDETYEIKLNEIKHNQQIAKSAFDFPRLSNEPLPDIKALLEQVRANADKIDKILENYSYTETRIEREIDKSGNLVEKGSETVSLSFYKGFRINRVIARNGKPLSPSEQAKEDRDIENQVKDIEERIAKREERNNSARTPGDDNRRITLSEALKGSLLINPRRERFRSRDVIVFDYEPNPEFKPQTRLEKLFALCSGAVWVDAESKQVVRLEAFLMQSAGNLIGKVKRGASFTLENELVNNEIYLPSRADVNLSIRILFAGININNLIKYGDYKRFDTEVKDGKVNEIKNP